MQQLTAVNADSGSQTDFLEISESRAVESSYVGKQSNQKQHTSSKKSRDSKPSKGGAAASRGEYGTGVGVASKRKIVALRDNTGIIDFVKEMRTESLKRSRIEILKYNH